MWEIEPVEVKVKIQDKKPPERIAESEAYKIGLDPCYIIIKQEGVFGESIHEFLYLNNSLHRVENTLSTTCEICGRLVVGKNNFPFEVSFNATQEMKNICDSCNEKYKGWDNYIESTLLFGAASCEDCGKPTSKVFTGQKIKVQVCEECINELTDMGFEKIIDANSPQSALTSPVQLKGKSKRKQIHKLKLTKSLVPYNTNELHPIEQKKVFDESIEKVREIPQILIKRKKAKEEWIKKKQQKENKKVLITTIVIFSLGLLFFLGFIIHDDYKSSNQLNELREKQVSTEPTLKQPSTNQPGKKLFSLEESINYLSQPKFSRNGVLDVRDNGGSVYITIDDSLWYDLTTSQKQQLADRLLDVIYASGDVDRIVYLKDSHSRIIAKQVLKKLPVGVGAYREPYMELK